jgi:hypothetical protein
MLDLWWASLSQTMQDHTMRFPVAFALGAVLGGFCWLLAAYSAKLWNRRYYLNIGLQVLCGGAALLTLLYTLTFASSESLEQAVQNRLTRWESEAKNDAKWRHEIFCKAWEEVARAGTEPDVRPSPSPRTDPAITTMSLNNPLTKMTVARVYGNEAGHYFALKCPYLATILKPPGNIPDEMLQQDLIEWFTQNPGTNYPAERGLGVLVKVLNTQASSQMDPIVTYTKRFSLGLFLVTQCLVFGLIALLAYRSIKPTR